ncbi:MAG: DUF4399 domain-containing protein [Rubrivivax sp.]|nr:DUF4399 domain-containing protein [Rubrivivax sp.]MDP3224310.1 DUF4399 domain-containing protein [Rubrivivax sp.]
MSNFAKAAVSAGLALLALATAAEPLPSDELERECWQQFTRERTRVRLVEPTAVDVSNLRDGQTVNSPFRVDFSIRGMGVIPAGKPHPKAGHHHVLVDMSLPINPGDQIPFNDFHRHFGKGQTGAVLALPPGPHRLRLLFADHDHRPYFVFSPEIRITVRPPRATPARVTRANFEASCREWYEDEISRPRPEGQRAVFSNVREGETVISPVNLRFAADGFGVAPKGHGGAGLGFFVLEVLRGEGVPPQVVDLSHGATQTTLTLSPGAVTLRLRFVDDSGRRELVPATQLRLNVSGQDRL